MVASASALRSVTKLSSASSLLNAVTMNTSFASQTRAFFTSSFWRWLSRRYAFTRLSALVRFFCDRPLPSRVLADEPALVHQAFHRPDGDLVELFALVRFEQFALHLRVSALAMSIATPKGIRR